MRRCPMKPIERITLFCALAALASACDSNERLAGPGALKALVADASGVPFTEGLASPAWQELARNFIGVARQRGLRDEVASGVPFTEGLASPAWQELARNFITQSPLSGNSAKATRVYAYLSAAQYDAVVRAEDTIGGSESETDATPGTGLGPGVASVSDSLPPIVSSARTTASYWAALR